MTKRPLCFRCGSDLIEPSPGAQLECPDCGMVVSRDHPAVRDLLDRLDDS